MGPQVVIIGAGPAGLTAAYELSKRGVRSVVLEKSSVVGGLARTEEYKGYGFDIGGHRFYTKLRVVADLWKEVLGADLIRRPRLSRVYYRSHFYHYPIEPWNALAGLGPREATRCIWSFLKASLYPIKPERNLQDWIINRFGRRLFEIFFKTYTEKVWGMKCTEIGAEWAAQRIRGLNMHSLLRNALWPDSGANGNGVKTLIREFDYPRRGPGMMWNRVRDLAEARGARVVHQAPVERIHWREGAVLAVEAGGETYRGDHFISTMPIRDLIACLDPPPSQEVQAAGAKFQYRDFLTVALILNEPDPFPDNWIYIHDPSVRVGRIQNYKNWSPDMVPDPKTTCLGLEYFCFEGDDLWNRTDAELIALAVEELTRLGLGSPELFLDGVVTRAPKAYPVYDEHYRAALVAVREFLRSVPNLQLAGRNGMHHYNNQDHSMLTAMLAARNILGASYDLWSINAGQDYLEDGFSISEEAFAEFEQSQPVLPVASAGTES